MKGKGVVRGGKGDLARIAFQDSGSGIAPEHLKKVFNPFFTTKPEGTGLGLSICSRLIEENLGKIDVVSEEDKGTCFTLYLPLGAPSKAS